jgi:hypothetical protein
MGWILVPCRVHYQNLVPERTEPLGPVYLSDIVSEADSVFEVDERGERTGRSWSRDSHWCLFPHPTCGCGGELSANQTRAELRRERPLDLELHLHCGCGRDRWVKAFQQTIPI